MTGESEPDYQFPGTSSRLILKTKFLQLMSASKRAHQNDKTLIWESFMRPPKGLAANS